MHDPDAGAVRADAERFMDRWMRAWAGQDHEAIVACYAPDGVMVDTPFVPPKRGHDEIRHYMTMVAAQENGRDHGWEILAVTPGHAIAKWWITYDVKPREDWPEHLVNDAWASFRTVGIGEGTGATLRQEGISQIRFAPDGRASFMQEWWMTASRPRP